jgi:branched-chain amino acid transport system permease protein
MDAVQAIVNGILLSGIYFSVASGLYILFRSLRSINLAHGDFVVTAGYLCLVVFQSAAGTWAAIAVIPVMFVLGYFLQSVVLNRFKSSTETSIITGIGLSIILQNVLLLVFNSDWQFLNTSFAGASINVGYFDVPAVYGAGFVMGLLLFGLLELVFKKTLLGIKIRAMGDDPSAAAMHGINPKKIGAIVAAIASASAGVAGIITGMTFTFHPHSGPHFLLTAFGVMVIGGMRSFTGLFIGSACLGVAQLLGAHFFGAGMQVMCGYIVALAMLALFPAGLRRPAG